MSVSRLLLKHLILAVVLLGLGTPVGEAKSPPAATSPKPAVAPTAKAQVLPRYGLLPLHFEANQGQTSAQVQYLSRGPGYSLYLTPTETKLVLKKPQDRRKSGPLAVLGILPVGARASAKAVGEEQLPGRAHYFIGKDPTRWRTNIPTYSKVHYRDIYPGIDLIFYGAQGQLEYDFVIAPGADPRAVRLRFTGADGLSLDRDGNLILKTAGGSVQMRAPVVYQEINGVRRDIAGQYVLDEKDQVSFQVASYDKSLPLVIDPVLFYSTYLGGIGDDFGNGVAVDAAGNAYVTGSTSSLDFPTAGAVQAAIAGASDDVFVAKMNATGTALVYSTYLGGSENDVGIGIALDTNGNAYVTGSTASPDFPTAFPIQPALGLTDNSTGGDAFVVKLDPNGAALVYSTYLGGSKDDIGQGIAVDNAGNAYVTGATASADFPTLNFYQGALGGLDDAFVSVLNSTGTAFVYSTYLGGALDDFGTAIAVDSGNMAYVTGLTLSGNFPTLGAFQGTHGTLPAADAFVVKLDPSMIGNASLIYSSYLGGSGADQGLDIAVDGSFNAYVTGFTLSANFTMAGTPFQSAFGGGTLAGDAFVTKVDPTGSALVYSTYLGGSGEDYGQGIAVDAAGNAYVTGTTTSINFPTTNPFQAVFGGKVNPFGGDAFVTKLNAGGSTPLVYSSYLGGSGDDFGSDIALDAVENVYVTGSIASINFPTVRPLQLKIGGGLFDAFLAKIAVTASPDLVVSQVLGPATGAVGQSLAVTTTIENQGPAPATAFTVGLCLSTSPTISTCDFPLGNRPVTSLAAGAISTATTTVTVPVGITPPVTYYLGAVADTGLAVTELNELNNAMAAATQIAVTDFKPDLVVTSVIGPDKSAPGLSLQLSATVENHGPAAAGAFTVSLYLSSNAVFDGPGTDSLLGSFAVANLAAGARLSFTTIGTVDPGVALAPYYILAVADPVPPLVAPGAVDELDENNNVGVSTAKITITDANPDLVITSLTAPATGVADNATTIAVTTGVGNSGPAAAGAFNVSLYLSANTVFDGPVTDTLLGSFPVTSLAAATNTSNTTTVTIPATITPLGLYYILAVADQDLTACPPGGAGAVPELNECNNVGATGTKINIVSSFLPDLTISAVMAPAKAGDGQNVEVTTTVKNIGPKDAGTFTVNLYFSTNGTIDLTDTLKGSRVLPGLAAGAQTTFTMTVQIPPGTITPGTPEPFFFGAFADPASTPCASNPGAVTELDECNNTKAAAATTVTDFKPDLKLTPLVVGDVKGQLIASGSSSAKGEGRVLSVTTKITNDGPAPSPPFVVEAYHSADATIDPADRVLGRQTLPGLQPGETVTAVISGAIPPEIVDGLSIPGTAFYVGVKVDPADLVDELLNSNNTSTLLLTPSLAGIATLPELTMESFSGPKLGAVGHPITVTGEVKNQKEPAGTFTVGVYLSQSPVIILPATPGTIFVGRLMSLASLDRDASSTKTAILTIPAEISPGVPLPLGNYYLGAFADPDFLIAEDLDEVINNAKTATDQIEIKEFKPDFVVKSVSGPPKGAVGQPLTISFTLENQGPAPSGPFTVGLYLSGDSIIDPSISDPILLTPDKFLGNVELPSVNLGGNTNGSKKVTIPAEISPGVPLPPGNYFLGAYADPANLIAETNGVGPPLVLGEMNNGLAALTQIDIQLFTPDLQIPAPPTIPATGAGVVGKTIEVSTSVKNDGQADAGPFTVGLYLTPTSPFIAFNPATDKFLGSMNVPGLKVGASAPLTTKVTIPVNFLGGSTTPGSFYLGVFADPDDVVLEVGPLEPNNTNSAAITIQPLLPDLIVTTLLGLPTQGAPGRTIDVTFTAKNNGTGPVGPFTVRLLLSDNATIELTDIPLVGGDVSIEGLEAGAETKPIKVTLPLPIPPTITLPSGIGTFTLGAYADPGNAVDELGPTGETNNAFAGNPITITTKPDLTVKDVSAPESGFPGQTRDMTVTVENIGPAAAGAFTVGLYLSTDGSITAAADRLLATLSFGSMDAGASSKTTTMVTIPSDLAPGDYFLGAFADPAASVDELNEANNAKAALTMTKIASFKSDLVMTTVATTGPAKGSPGKIVSVTTEVKNQGAAAAGAFAVGVFLSADNALDPTVDRFLGFRSVTSLAVNITSTAITTLTIPADVQPGTYSLLAVADYTATVSEQKEDNNVMSAPIEIVAFKPDLTVPSVISPFRVAAGQLSVPVTVTISNLGPLAAAASVGIYLSPMGVFNQLVLFGAFKAGAIDPVQHRLLQVPTSLTVGANATVTTTIAVTIPKDVAPKPYFLGAYVDPGGLVDEVDETNNGSFALNFVTVTPAQPDLTMSLQTVPPVGSPGKPLVVTHTVTNKGTVAAGAFAIKLYLSQGSSLMPEQDWFLGSVAVGSLAINGVLTTATTVPIPPDVPPGKYNLDVRANPDGRVVELDKTNNGDTKLIQIKPFLPDLTVTSVSGPAKAAAGQAVTTMAATVKNEGAAGATTAFSVALYLSADLKLDGADRFVGVLPVASVPVDTSVTTLPAALTIPADLPPGKYFLVAVVDSGATVAELDETNNVKFSSSRMEITPFLSDLAVTVLTVVPPTASPTKLINVSTTVQNQGPVLAAASTVGFYLSTDNVIDPATDRFLVSRPVPSLAVNGTSAASTPVTIPADVEVGSYFLGAVVDPGTSVAETDETNNTKASAVQIKLSLPDLVVSALLAPATGAAGQKIKVANTVKNQGLAPAAASMVRFYLSADGAIDPATDRFLGSRLVPSLAVNGASAVSTDVTIPPDVAPGKYFIGAVADAINDVAEQDDVNNARATEAQTDITLFKPDLDVTAVSGPAKAVVGATISVSSTVKNQGPAPATGPFTVGFYLSSGKVVDPTTARFLGSRSVVSLGAGIVNTVAATPVVIPVDVAPGAYFLGAVADPAASLDELGKINNARAAANPIQITANMPDLVITAVSTTAVTVIPNATISVSSTVQNVGPAPAVGPFTVGLYLSSDSFLDATDQFLANRPSLASLAAGAVSAAATPVTIPLLTTPGTYYVIAVADPPSAVLPVVPVPELDETNNMLVTALPIRVVANQPDLVVTTVSGSTTGVVGQNLTATATVKNQGPAAAGPFVVGFYLSADPSIDPAADTLLGTVVPVAVPVAGLAAGASITLTKTAAIPVVTPGPYFLGAAADSGSAIVESDETNNARAALNRITIASNLPDLVVTAVSVPSTGGVGQTQPIPGIVGKTLVVTTTVKNQGSATAAGPFAVSVYLSADAVFDGGDTLLGARTVPSLAAGAVSTGTITTSAFLAGQIGSHFLLAVADPPGAIFPIVPVAESDEANNVRLLANKLPIKDNLPDLVMTAVSTTTVQMAVGKTISVSNTVKNQGSATAVGPFTIRFTLEPGSILLGTRSVASLAAGAINTASTTVTIPAPTTPGDYFLVAVADSDLSITEQDETNNGLFAFLPIRITDNQPDLDVTAVSGPLTGAIGKTIAVTNVIENRGHAPAGSSRVDFYLSTNGTALSHQLTGSRTLTLAAGAISSVATTVTIPLSVPPASYYLIAVADAAAQVPTDSNVGNNTAASLVKIDIQDFKPDLVMTAVSGPATGTIGKTIVVANTIQNQGLNTTGVSSRIDFYLSTDGTALSFQLTGFRTVASLAAGANSVGTTTVTIPLVGVPQGTYYLLAVADAGNTVTTELNEGNNRLASDRQIVVTKDLPDLVMTSVAGPTVGVAGMTIPVSTTVLNAGSKALTIVSPAPAPQATFYLSTDNDIAAAGDTLLTGPLAVPVFRTISTLAVKAISAGTTTVTIPPGVTPGTYYVGAIVDQAVPGAVTEIDEVTNNTLAAVSTITVLPKLKQAPSSYTTLVGTVAENGCLNPLLDGNGNFNTTLTISTQTGASFSGTAAGTIVLSGANATFDETMTLSGRLTQINTVTMLEGTFTVTTKQGVVFVGSGSGTFSGTILGTGALDLVFEGQDRNGVTCKFIRTLTTNP